METKNNNQVPQEQALHLIQSGLNIFRDEIFRLQTELEKLKQPEFKVLRGGYTYKDGVVPTPPNCYIPQPGEVVLIGHNDDNYSPRIFVKYDQSSNDPFICVIKCNEKGYRQGREYATYYWEYCRRLNGEIIEFGCDKAKNNGK